MSFNKRCGRFIDERANPWIILTLESVLGHGPAFEAIPGSQRFLL